MNIELHIEELVLHGFPPGDRHRIGDAVEHELSRLFAEKGVPPALIHGGDIPHLSAGAFKILPGTRPDTVGTQVAWSLYGGMAR